MKKLTVLLLLLALTLCFAACAAPEAPTDPTETTYHFEDADPEKAEPLPNATEATEPTEHTHAFEATETVKKTCTQDGSATFTCSCGESYTETDEATGHVWGAWTTVEEPTEEKDGLSQRKCGTCGETESQVLEHNG